MTRHRLSALRENGDNGAALITVLLLIAALTAVTSTVAMVTTNDTLSAGRDRQAAGALATADAGVAAAVSFIRHNGIGNLTCMEADLAACAANPAGWTNPSAPQQVRVDGLPGGCVAGSTCYQVSISTVTQFNPPAQKSGRYRIRSTGFTGSGPGAKAVVVDISATPMQFPIGVYGHRLTGNGGTSIKNEMLFTQDCVSPRNNGSGNGTSFEGVDPYWGEPASANSTTFVSTSNNCGESGKLHKTGACPTNAALVHDRTSLGGPVSASSACANYNGAPLTPPRTSTLFNLQILQEKYGYRPGGLSSAEYEALRVQAASQGTYNVPVGSLVTKLTDAVNAGVRNPVVFWDTGNISFKDSDIPTIFSRVPNAAPCSDRSVTIVVRNGDLTYQGGTNDSGWRTMSVFVPDGNFRGNGGYNVLGTLFALDLSLGGSERWALDDCFVDNVPGPLVDVELLTFREDDRNDIG